jgi:hypothetical protein
MTKLFQNFKKYNFNDWKENIIEEFDLKTFLNLHKKIEGIDISPIKHNFVFEGGGCGGILFLSVDISNLPVLSIRKIASSFLTIFCEFK